MAIDLDGAVAFLNTDVSTTRSTPA